MRKAMKAQKVTTTSNADKFIKATATEDITVSVANNDKDVKSSSLEIETAAGTVYVRGFVRKNSAGGWFFCAPSHKYNDKYVNDVFFNKQINDSINNAVNAALN